MIEKSTLAAVEHDVAAALAASDPSGLNILGYGEISLVIGWPTAAPRWACKRLPPFRSKHDADAFADLMAATSWS